MRKKHFFTALYLLLLSENFTFAQKQWTLQQCIDYALENNISLKQKQITNQQKHEDVLQSRSALFPSISFSTNQNVSYRPYAESTVTLENGTMTTNSGTVTYNGSYGINANWTVWNGNKNRLTIKQNKISEEASELDVEQEANNIQEQIAQLYIQILYENEAVKVNEEIVKASQLQVERANTMVEVGSLAKVDKVQLEAQVAQDQYSLVQAQSQLANYKLQLKQLLEIHNDEDFDVVIPSVDDSKILNPIPNKNDVYNAAVENRPEIKSSKLNIEMSELALKSSRTGYMPTLSLSAGIGTSNSSGSDKNFGQQLKTNLNNSIGLTLSVPIFDNLSTRTNIRKAKYTKLNNELQLQDAQKQLYSTVENYYLNASNSQQQYVYAKKNEESMQESYDLVSEQFNLGLKNIVELTTGKNNLLQAQQALLQTKYTALLNIALLKFYEGEKITL
ncbi:MAG: TolC family protein [Bacteroidaceae bacterium]|nr:TolC family protein [Bacteroidaceae bacterium]